MNTAIRNMPLLKLALLADAIASGATGLMMAVGAGVLAEFLALPESLMRYAGLFVLPYAAFVALVGLRPVISQGLARLIVALNSVWSVGSIALIAGDWVSPNLLGVLFVTGQAAIVAAFAAVQLMALRTPRVPQRS